MSEPEQPAEQPQQVPAQITFTLPPEQEGGTYANIAAVWHDNDGFIVDFSVITTPPQPVTNDAGQTVAQVSAKVVSRVRIPVSQAWELMRALNDQLGQWEREHGVQPPAGQ